MEKDPPNLMPALYSHRLRDIQETAIFCGYCIAVHGSMQRDLDLVAIPWVDSALSASALVGNLCEKLGLTMLNGDPVKKPHGRMAYTLMMGGNCFMDLSVMPRSTSGR